MLEKAIEVVLHAVYNDRDCVFIKKYTEEILEKSLTLWDELNELVIIECIYGKNFRNETRNQNYFTIYKHKHTLLRGFQCGIECFSTKYLKFMNIEKNLGWSPTMDRPYVFSIIFFIIIIIYTYIVMIIVYWNNINLMRCLKHKRMI